MWIAWNCQDTDLSWPLTFEQKVGLFYQQTLGWQLHIADLVANGGTAYGEEGEREGNVVCSIRHSGFAVLQICLSYFETIGYYTGEESGSRAAFRKGVEEVFPNLLTADTDVAKAFIDSLYEDARCGLYHNTRTARVGLGWPPEPVAIAFDQHERRVLINPERLPGVLKTHLEVFREALLNGRNQELRMAFERRFDRDSGIASS